MVVVLCRYGSYADFQKELRKIEAWQLRRALVIPILVCDLFVGAVKGALEKLTVANEVPVAVLIKFPAGSFKGSGPDRSPLFSLRESVVTESHRKIDIFDRDEFGIETADCFEAFPGRPKGAIGHAVFGEVGDDHHGAGHDAERPSFRDNECASANDRTFEFFENDAEKLRVELTISIDGDDDFSRGGRESSIADFSKVLRFFARDHGAELSSNLFCAVSATIENDHGFNVTRADFGCGSHRGESSRKIFLLVVSRDDDGDFHS